MKGGAGRGSGEVPSYPAIEQGRAAAFQGVEYVYTGIRLATVVRPLVVCAGRAQGWCGEPVVDIPVHGKVDGVGRASALSPGITRMSSR